MTNLKKNENKQVLRAVFIKIPQFICIYSQKFYQYGIATNQNQPIYV
jgi:hypothetical protein